jgi:hypothetical protein
MADATARSWKMSLLQDHMESDCVVATAIGWSRECEVEEVEQLLNAPWKRESMKVELW